LGPPAGAANPNGCEKHAIAGPGYGHGGTAVAPVTPAVTKLAAIGGAGAGLVALGGIGGLVGGFGFPGTPGTTVPGKGKGTTTNPSPPNTTPGTPPTQVPEPSTLVIFMFAVLVALAARHFYSRRPLKSAAPSP